MSVATWLVIGLIIFLVILGIILIYVYWDHDTQNFLDINSNPVSFAPPTDQPVGFLFRCGSDSTEEDSTGFTCGDGLTCDDATDTCRISNGSKCNAFADCLTTSYCSGICLDREDNPPELVTGETGDPCPCDINKHECILGTDQKERCLLKPGSSCVGGTECSSGICDSGKCTSGEPLGSECTADKDCVSKNCSVGFCQSPGVNTGDLGAICGSEAQCGNGLLCSTKTGTCVLANIGLGSGCNTSVLCSDPLICVQTDILGTPDDITCDSASTGCECKYMTTTQGPEVGIPSPNKSAPNEVDPGSGKCSEQFACAGDVGPSVCVADAEQFCVSDGDCSSNTCQNTEGSSKLYQIDVLYSNQTDVFPGNGITGSTRINWNPLSGNPPSEVKQLYSYILNGNDQIFALASDGFYSFNGTIWTKLVDSVPTRLLIDASV